MNLVGILAALALLSAPAMADLCASAADCQTCVAINLCGWCSVPVSYPDGSTGPQCAGFAKGSKPFICDGIYSTESCKRGWVCDGENGQCVLGPAGGGLPHSTCTQACHGTISPVPVPTPPPAQVYLCDAATSTCNVVAPGTPGSTSYIVCMAQCAHSMTPAPGPIQKTYLCNASTWTCDPTTPGHGASKIVCEQSCNSSSQTFVCLPNGAGCTALPPGSSGGQSLSSCLQTCNATLPPSPTLPPNPGPPPEYIGVWRGVQIQNDYTIDEWDLSINITTVVLTRVAKKGAISWRGVPYHTPDSAKLEMWILIKTGKHAGHYVRTIGDTSGEQGPMTIFATMAMSPPGGSTPTSITSAMTDGVNTVFAWQKCIPGNPFCTFSMASAEWDEKKDRMRRYLTQHVAAGAAKKTMAKKQPAVEVAIAAKEKPEDKFYDRCSQYGSACSVCLSQTYCGWCSVNVVYSDGSVGTQCAGFQGNSSFVCQGRYTTTSCEVGYICDNDNTCTPSQPGDGMPQSVCLATCKATPAPNPTVPQYVCNLVTHQCSLCTAAECPGSMPQGQCETLCPNPFPGPTPDMVGVWRGLYIENNYPAGEVDLVLNSTGAFFYKNGVLFFGATVISLGADVMLWTITSGTHEGHTIGVLYQMAMTDYGMYWQGTFALSALDQGFPTGYNHAMYTTGMHELVLAQCLQPPCQFNPPA